MSSELDWAEKLRKLDEACTMLSRHLPPLWSAMYRNLQAEGFTEEQALSLLKCFILRDGQHGLHIHQG